MKLINVAGEAINYKSYGKGKPFVMLHGFGGNHNDWDEIAREYANEGYETIIPNFTSLYLSPGREITFSQQVHLLRSLLEVFADEKGKVTLAGASYGGALSWAVAIAAPDLVEKIVLVNPMPPHPRKRFKDPILKIFISLAKYPAILAGFILSPAGRMMLPHLERLFRFAYLEDNAKKRNIAHMTERKLKVILHVVQRFLWICDQENWAFWESRLGNMETPTQLIWGDQDKLFDRSVYLRL
ncbi:MAG: alpha/beta fold hydrolase, partial [Bdellovibrionales bacterium]|nr:alpha/beta fold hydrolase [Bdellovibrionales bacterium]